ncbi:O-antigen ligase family protein [Patescibacteria group bacterium]|nr:O-antigen ligase family protein [Patescibacteria group bacterium]MBU2543525.1 O-antigen ligase family protein [Patescibacteria group bacterium]
MTKKHSSIKQLTKWLDKNILLLLSGFLLIFIPLFPKIPFYSPIEEYIVRVRLEDFLVLFVIIVWVIQLIRKKIKWQSTTAWFVIAYAVVGLLSIISAIFIIKTVPIIDKHVLKTFLHFVRYLEYFSLFFIFYSSLSNSKGVKILLGFMSLSLLAVAIYGVGQKYYYWPVYSTMNREFSKGIRLYLTQHARVQSTFAGHYDLAAYLVIVLPLLLALAYYSKQKLIKGYLFFLQFFGAWLLIMSAARTSFIAYALSTVIVISLFGLKKESLRSKISWIVTRLLGLWIGIFILMVGFGSDIYERAVQVIKSYPQVYSQYQRFEKQTQKSATTIIAFLQIDHLKIKQLGSSPPANSISTQEAEVLVASDQRPITQRPVDVYADIPDQIVVATTSADGSFVTAIVEKPRVWSDNALQYGLSMAIRLDTLWPRAVQGFVRSPFLGSGYATLNKTSPTDFTIADSTDNNFLRTLGETGLLGFITFYGAIITSMVVAILGLRKKDALLSALCIGYLAAALGLLFNAFFIDVFSASKVAFTFWAVTGLFLGYYKLKK